MKSFRQETSHTKIDAYGQYVNTIRTTVYLVVHLCCCINVSDICAVLEGTLYSFS